MLDTYFHLYGFILGCATGLGIYLSEKKAEVYIFSKEIFWQLLTAGLIGGIIGARLWHVVTDFHLYQENLLQVFYIWNGGLSSIGGILGGLLGIFVTTLLSKKITSRDTLIFLDLSVFGLPFAQAVGRLGNWVNHELYGLPTSLPWGIFIPPEYREQGFENFVFFHPLFAYEAMVLLFFGGLIWWLDCFNKKWLKIGSGRSVLLYLVYYSVIRFLLDFLRIETAAGIGNLGFNQVILILVAIISGFLLSKNLRKKKI